MGLVCYKRDLGKEASPSHCVLAELEPGSGSSPDTESPLSWTPHV